MSLSKDRISLLKYYLSIFKRSKQGVIGLFIIIVFILLAISAPLLTPYDPLKLGSPDELLTPPSLTHILGTDDLGRDIFAQLIYGSRVSLLVGFSAAFISIALGSIIGLIAGYVGGLVDELLMRMTDIVMVLPALPLMIVLSALLGRSLINIIIVISIVGWPYSARVIRSQVLSIKERPFIEAARCIGAGRFRIIFREIFPNVIPLMIAEGVLYIASAIYSEAVLSFLGLGDPMNISWGMMLNFAFSSGVIAYAWWWVLPPGLSTGFIILGFALLGNAINEILNPRSRLF